MHSGYEIPGIQHQQPSAGENTRDPVLLSMNHTHILDQIHNSNALPAAPTQQLFLDQHHFLPHDHHHHYAAAGGGASSAYFPVNFKLGLNEICSRNNHDYRDVSTVSNNISINERAATDGGDLLRGSEQYELPEETRHHPSLGILHCWQNQQDSPIKQPRFWEPLAAEASNENSEIVEREQQQQQQHMEILHQKDSSKSRVQFNELEAIYNKPLVCTNDTNQTGPSHIPPPVNPHVSDQEQQDQEEEEETSESFKNNAGKKRKKKKKHETSFICNELVDPMSEFLESFTKQVMDHQENLHRKFSEVIERLDEERRAREEAWRNQELAHFEEEWAARARDRASARSREAIIVSYLEKITGHKIDFDFQRNNEDDQGVN